MHWKKSCQQEYELDENDLDIDDDNGQEEYELDENVEDEDFDIA